MTTDERLAALEAKMDALTAPPSDYYTSRYSGEEIDAAIAAVPGKAETAQLCNRNLLDNWYFGNPLDQRGGYVVLPGTTYYDNTWTAVGTTTGYLKIDSIIPTGGAWITIGGTQYLVSAPSDSVVRGYAGTGYTVDRWYFDTDSGSCTLTLTNEGVKFIATAGATGIASLKQVIDPTTLSALAGKTVTLSTLGKTDIAQQVLFYVNGQVTAVNSSPAVSGVCMTTLTYTFPEVLTDAATFIYGRSYSGAGEGTILAAKLELGSQQTLAHQDADGNWVLNEVPDYGEQLRRCQRYFYRLKAQNSNNFGVWALGYLQTTTQGRFLVNFPNTMRTLPTHTMSGTLQMYSKTSGYAVTSLSHQAFNGNSLLLMANCAANEGFVVGNTVSLGAMNDPNAYIDFSADL